VGKGTVTALRAAGEQRTSAPAAQPLSKCVWMEILDSRLFSVLTCGRSLVGEPNSEHPEPPVGCSVLHAERRRGRGANLDAWFPGPLAESHAHASFWNANWRTPARLLLAPLLSNRAAGKGGASLPTVWTRCPSDGRVRPPCGCRTEVVSIRCLPCGKQRQGWTVGSARTSSPTLFIGKHCFMSGWLSMSVRASDTDVTVRPYL
jgi:hypothetical protein